MVCPECKNKGFIKSEDCPRAIQVYGNKDQYATVNYRNYICLMCGYKWKTKEVFERKIVAKQIEMFPQKKG